MHDGYDSIPFYGLSREEEERISRLGDNPVRNSMSPEVSHGRKLSDVQLAIRRAEEAANRRSQASAWLQRMMGPLDLTNEPSEEELRHCLRNGLVLCNLLNKVHPGAQVKVVANPAPSTLEEGAHSAYQYFENVRNFIVAVEEMGLPTFEASDLEEVSYLPGSSAKVVDSVLALKAYHDWKLSGGSGFWKYGGSVKSPRLSGGRGFSGLSGNGVVKSPSLLSQTNMSRPNNLQRKRWDGPDEVDISSPDCADLNGVKVGRVLAVTIPQANGCRMKNGACDLSVESENLSSPNLSDSTATWIQHIGYRIREVLQGKTKHTQDFPSSDDKENSGAFNSYDDVPSQSLLSLVSAIIGDKHPEEVPMLVEFILRKVMEEFERRLHAQGEQVKKTKSALKEILAREERLASRAKVLEALAAGTGEEVKLVSNQLQQVKMEKRHIEEEKRTKEEDIERLMRDREEKQLTVDVLRNELEMIKRADQEQKLQLQLQKREMEMESKIRIQNMESQLIESQRKARAVEAGCASELRSLRQKSTKYEGAIWQQSESIQELKAVSNRTRQEVTKLQVGWNEEMEKLGAEMLSLAKAASGYHRVLEENRQLYNEVQDLKGNIRVYCRVRPFLPNQLGRQSTVDFVGESGDLIIVNPNKHGKDARKTFSFNKVFDSSASQERVFLDTQPLIRSVLDGFNVCIFAYGQTGSGKTYTMSGPTSSSTEGWGVNYRALNDLFEISQIRKDVINYEVGVQMIEIYNEQVRDLLVSDGASKRLEIRNSSQQNGLNVPDASMMPVSSTADVLELMKIGQKNRAVGATALNERSSRSHSVLTVHVQGIDVKSGAILRGCLHLVDLAGSERVDKSEATGERLKEAQHINKSLSALGDVISALAQKNAHVPYRNSKLTQLLQDSLGGQAKTLMFVHISPDLESYGETVSTLKFAERVATVELGAARSHKESGDIRDLKEQIGSLKDLLAKKEGEIERLTKEMKAHELRAHEARAHETRTHWADATTMERSKPKAASIAYASRRMSVNGEVQVQKQKKQSSEAVFIAEGQQPVHASINRAPKHRSLLTISVSQDGSSEDREAESPLDSPAGKKLSSEEGHKKPYDIQRRGTSNMSTSPDSDPPRTDLSDTGHNKQRGTWNLAGESQSASKEWQDRIRSGFLGTAWRDGEYSSQGFVDGPSSSSNSDFRANARGQAEVSPREQQPSVVSGEESEPIGLETNGCQEVGSKKDLYASVDALLPETFRNGTLERRDAEGEERSDYSEGELSQGTDASSVHPTDSLLHRQEEPNTKKPDHSGERRSQGQNQIRRPPGKADRKQGLSEHPHGRFRRHSSTGAAATASGPESKRVSSVGTRHGADAHAFEDLGKSAVARHPGFQPPKSSKRWL